MLISLTVGKVDAGVAVLLTEDKRLIEFPSILLPSSITCGSIVDITVTPNPDLEAKNTRAFATLQHQILETYGVQSPSPPVLRLRNATQTSIVLEWDSLALATATLRSLALFRNNAKAGLIPRYSRDGEEVLATKVSGLAVDTEYTFHLLLRTSAGTYASNRLVVRTQKMTDLTGITVTPGPMPPPLRTSLGTAIDRIGAKLVEGVRIDTTHFVCIEGRGREWERAVEMNIPVVRPEWVEGCEREGRIVGVRGYYLGADPKSRQVGPGVGGANRGGMASPGMASPPIKQESQTSLPTHTRGPAEESQTSLAAPTPERERGQPSPVTPWPPGVGGRAGDGARPEALRGESEEGSEDEQRASGGPPPNVPAKDEPKEEEKRERPGSESEEEEASGTVSPEEEAIDGDSKPALSTEKVGESQSNFSDVQL